MKKRMTWGIWILAVLAFIEYWRVIDIDSIINIPEDDGNSYLINSNLGIVYKTREELLKNKHLNNMKKQEILANRKIYIRSGSNLFRTATFVTDDEGNLLYFDRDIFWCCVGNQTLAGDFREGRLTKNEVIYYAWDGGFEVRIPLHPNWLQRMDAKIIQWISKVIY